MIIHSIRLKNIKSYGEGAGGNGVLVAFEPGVNRIAGKNGHGKSTLIESLGYALFLAEPEHQENFQLATYFLRHGCKSGEIDVTFGYAGNTYRIERGVGPQNRRRAKVVDPADGSTCAEGDREVAEFLRLLFDFPDAGRLPDLFVKLIGVRQGRLTWPFDSKPSAAKQHFEPLLEVEIFRRCFDDLKPAMDRIESLAHELEVKLGGIDARIQDRADSPARLEECRRRHADLGGALEAAQRAQDLARAALEGLQKKEEAVRHAEKEWADAGNAAGRAADACHAVARQVEESNAAAAKIAECAPGDEAFRAAETALNQLRVQETARGHLERRKAEAEKLRIGCEANARAAAEQAGTFAGQAQEKKAELESVRERRMPLAVALERSAETHAALLSDGRQLEADRHELAALARTLRDFPASRDEGLQKIADLAGALGGWDPQLLAAANDREAQAEAALRVLRENLAQTDARKESRAQQLAQIAGGVCPFLKEACRQFDPAKVEADVASDAKAIGELAAAAAAAEKALAGCRAEREALARQQHQLEAKRPQLADAIEGYLRAARDMIRRAATEATRTDPRRAGGSAEPFPSAPPLPAEAPEAGALPRLHGAVTRFCEEAQRWWKVLEPLIAQRLAEIDQAKARRVAEEHEARGLAERSGRLEREISGLADQEKAKREAATTAEGEAKAAGAELARIADELEPFAGLGEAIARQESLRRHHRATHEQFIAARPAAERLREREADLQEKRKQEAERADALRAKETALAGVREGFDPAALEAARGAHDARKEEAITRRNDLKHAGEAMEAEAVRFEEWQRATREKAAVEGERAKLETAKELGQLARNILQRSAPAVAQHLCQRIAARAQRMFNQINHDAVELTWEANNYSLRVAPGDRRFAMLSGGEQTKLALAMTLALAQQFCDLRFCIFDEPTYGVDADSRPLLADAILEAQAAAGLEQLLLVSHDDAFEGKIEHAVLLEKTAAAGSRPAGGRAEGES